MKPLDAEAFTEAVRAALQAVAGVQVTGLRPLALAVEVDGRVGTLDLATAFRRACREPHLTQDIVQQAVLTLPEATAAAPLELSRVLPMARTLEDLARLAGGRAGGAGRTRPLAGELVLSLVLDGAHSLRALSDLDCDRLGRTDADLWAAAIENLGRKPLSIEGDGAVRQVLAGGDYDATCLVHPRLCQHLPLGAVAAAPARGVLLLAADDSRRVRRELAELAAEVHHTRAHPLSPQLLRWTGQGWRRA